MNNEWAPAPPPRAPRKWPKRLMWTGLGLFVFILIAYFIVTSSAFFESVVLPKVGESVRGEVTVSSASISPFRRVTLRDLELRASRLDEPIFKSKEISIRYSLWSLMRGSPRVHEILVDSPFLQVVEFADGRRNIDPLLDGLSSGPSPRPSPAATGETREPLALNLQSFLLTNATVRWLRHRPGGGRDMVTVAGASIALTNLANGGVAGLNLGTSVRLDHVPDIGATNDTAGALRLALTGAFQCWTSQALSPEAVKGKATLDVLEAAGAQAELAGLQALLDAELSLSRIVGLSFTFRQGAGDLGRVRLHGPLSAERREGNARLEISGLDRRALNLAGAALGLDFGNTTLNATNDLQLKSGGQVVSIEGGLRAGQFSVTSGGRKTVPIDLAFDYAVNLDRPAQKASLRMFSLSGYQGGLPILLGGLSQPMDLTWSEAEPSFGESAFQLTATNLNLADWSAFLGDVQGMAVANLSLNAADGGKRCRLDLASRVAGLAVSFPGNRFETVDLNFDLKSRLQEFRDLRLEQCRLEVTRHERPVLTASVSGTAELRRREADLECLLHLFLPTLAGVAMTNPADVSLSSGEARLIASLRQRNLDPGQTNRIVLDRTVTGRLNLVDVTGRGGACAFEALESQTDFQADLKEDIARLVQCQTSLRQQGQEAGSIRLQGDYALNRRTANLSLELAGLNQHILSSFLPPPTNGPALHHVGLNVKTDLRYDPKGASLARIDAEIADLILPGGFPDSRTDPVTFRLGGNATLEKGVVDLREMKGDFLGRGAGAGRLSATARYDTSNRTGRVSVNLEDLDQRFLAPLLARSLGEMTLSNGAVRLSLHGTYDAARESVLDGEFTVRNWVIHDPARSWPRQPLELNFKLAGGMRERKAHLGVSGGQVLLDGKTGGQFSMESHYDLDSGAVEGRLGLTDFNEKLAGPFLANALTNRELVSLSINTDLSVVIDPQQDSRLNGVVKASNFLIRDPATDRTLKPLSAELNLNVGMQNQTVSLDSVKLSLSPTVRARNEMTITGRVDLLESNAFGGNLRLVAESMDLTPYYDFFVAQPAPPAAKTNEDSAAATDEKPGEPSPDGDKKPIPVEPDPVALPFHAFAVDAEIGRLFLREIELADWQTKVRLDTSKVLVKPMTLTANGAPLHLETDLDFSVPGYRYHVLTRLNPMPIGPIANTLLPESHGQYQGDILADVSIQGAGVTGKNLRSNLQGRVDFSLTNAVIDIDQPAMNAFLMPAAILLRAPDLMKTPMSWAGARLAMGEGQIQIETAGAVSPLFACFTAGGIEIGDDLMQSSWGELPVTFCLQRDLARQARLLPRGVPREDTYVLLPDFLKVTGNLAKPKSKVDKAALTTSVFKRAVNPVTGQEKPPSSSNPFDFAP